MRIPRIYHPQSLQSHDAVILTEDARKHVMQVLRLQVQSPIILFDGNGGEFQGVIKTIDKRTVTVQIGDYIKREVESPLFIHLGQVISRGEKMDFTIQKAVELGVSEITPLISERCNVKLPTDRLQKKMAHWQSIIISACEQSGRNRVPVLHTPVDLNQWLTGNYLGLKLILHPSTNQCLLDKQNTQKQITVLVGCEGGFTTSELDWAIANHFQHLTLGPRILRTETAALTAISVLQCKWGDFN